MTLMTDCKLGTLASKQIGEWAMQRGGLYLLEDRLIVDQNRRLQKQMLSSGG